MTSPTEEVAKADNLKAGLEAIAGHEVDASTEQLRECISLVVPVGSCRAMSIRIPTAGCLGAGAAFLLALLLAGPGSAAGPRAGAVERLAQPPTAVLGPNCNEKRVTTPDELETTLRSDFVGCVIIPKDKFFNMTGRSAIPLRTGVWLRGERGELGSRPSLFTDTTGVEFSLFDIAGNNVRVSGLHLRGPANGNRSSEQKYTFALQVTEDYDQKLGRGILIADNEFNEWTGAGVHVKGKHEVRVPEQYEAGWGRPTRDDAGLVLIQHNFFHHNALDGGGYGVSVGGGSYATVEGNVFDFNRHAVAASGGAYSGYIARSNYILQGGFMQDSYYNQHFDVHGTNDTNGDNHSTGYGGTAGEYYEIAFNAIRGAQKYSFGFKTRPSFMLRGAPTIGAYFQDNVDVHEDLDSAVALKWEKGDSGIGEDQNKFHFYAARNQFNTDNADQLTTGDFDGDHRTDVFITTGTAWFYSRGGSEPWEFLHASTKLKSELGLADIDNDGTTDVLYRDPAGNVGYLKSGIVPLAPLTRSPVAMKDMRFGDFDGDHLTDIFYTRAGQWQVWYGSTRTWTPTQTSSLPISAFLFGEFDDVPGTDVVAVTGGVWAYSSGATRPWTKLNNKLRPSFAGAVVADFDGDGKSDIAFDEGRQMWSYSPGGRLPMRSLREGDGLTPYRELQTMLIGRFDVGARAQVVSYYHPIGDSHDQLTDHLVIWRGARRGEFEALSREAMR
jgi:hypothetical protein